MINLAHMFLTAGPLAVRRFLEDFTPLRKAMLLNNEAMQQLNSKRPVDQMDRGAVKQFRLQDQFSYQ